MPLQYEKMATIESYFKEQALSKYRLTEKSHPHDGGFGMKHVNK